MRNLFDAIEKNTKQLDLVNNNLKSIAEEVKSFKAMFSTSGSWGASSLLDRIKRIETQVESSATQLKEINKKTK